MKKSILITILVASLSGCVVAPYRPYQPVYQPEPVVVYPQYESAYIWDPVALSFFFVYGGHRHYMPRGWHHH